ncbi:unnamed protein product [marine sediment metagenome]|uniref:Uncharacterized protein n=1 Tax=marine sediment metagenome TaxID=412755 RepID=X1CGC4_9ZZZZ
MVIGSALFVLAVVIIAIWVIIEAKRMRHKLLAIFLIALILFSYLSVSIIFKDQDIDFKTMSGVITASKIYFSWLGSVFSNMKQITTKAIHMDWGLNKTAEDAREGKSIFSFGKQNS